MDFFLVVTVVAFALYTLKLKDERRRIALLASQLGKYQIEKLMETLTQGYLRALGEKDPERSDPIWRQMESSETRLAEQFSRFAAEFARVPEADARISKLPLSFPFAARVFPRACFDMRAALALHASAIARAAEPGGSGNYKSRAYTMSAEMLLMQHTCHWFCKSKSIATARMVVRHRTTYDKLLASVSSETRRTYSKLIGR